MRQIEFRGKTARGEWVYGSFVLVENRYYIVPRNTKIVRIHGWEHIHWDALVEVIPETVRQFSGLLDNKGVKMYEGDIVKGGARIMQLIFKQEACQFWLIWKDEKGVNRYEPLTASYGDKDGYFSNDSLEVIGNIHETAENL